MSFSESIDINVTSHTADAAEDLREVGKAADEAKTAVDDLDKSDIDIAIDDAQLPSVKQELEDIRDAAEKADAQDVTVDVNTPGADDSASSLGRVADQGGRVRGVMENVAGNAAQDIAEVAGVSPNAASGLGLLAEAGASGAIGIGALGAAAAGLVVGSLVMDSFAERAKRLEEIKAFEDRDVKNFTDALLEGLDAIEAVKQGLTEVAEIRFALPFLESQDAAPGLAALGLTVDDFAKLVAGSEEQLDTFTTAMRDNGVSSKDLTILLEAVRDQQDNLGRATDEAAKKTEAQRVVTQVFGTELDTTKGKVDDLKTSIDGLPSEKTITIKINDIVPSFFEGLLPGAGNGNAGVTINHNYHAPAPSPAQQEATAREWRRVQEGPGSPS